ncbi:site-specific integrase [Streptomyces sp. NBC_01017]|uniref:tyrosine-type recombinase/integrase n=1 Tax=Streptomyces sp. NBC_01017 TaxID=2903721 RepID=UPI003868E963|nr:site-specific integrase [Streptomyces sp. NBC_01017]WSV26900.1 site-specific integrase [Streptomyces sp. NBC_01017]WSV34778.1 site-specific integrase [Streptomyces sp. NBC_01017]WSV35027.1 site-specific integrase [Streptomyces sp. NBC_01017]
MSSPAPLVQGFFTDRLAHQRQASGHTVVAYRDTIRLLFRYASQQTGKQPTDLDLADLDAALIGAFLTHLENTRGNGTTTRNARPAAIHSLFRYAAFRSPEYSALIQQVLAIPSKRTERRDVCYLTRDEIEALPAAPDLSTWWGRRDHTLLHLAVQTGLRVCELTGVQLQDIYLGRGPRVLCHGKGRKDRATPLTRHTVTVLRGWLAERGGDPTDPLFCTHRGGRLSPDAVARLVAKHTAAASVACASLRTKNVTPHTLRHTAAMSLLHAGADTSVIALWLGHESQETSMIYLHADMTLKERALARTTPPDSKPGRYTAPDPVLAFLDSL